MSNMSETHSGVVGRTRRIGIVTALVVAAATVAGCSSSGESYDMDDGGAEGARLDSATAYEEGAVAEDGDGAVEAYDAEGAPVAADQSLIVTGSLYITVEDPIEAADEAADIVQGSGGRIDARNETAADEYDGGSASLTLRIPQNELDTVVDDLRELGTVDHYSTDSRDVSIEVTDLEAKISTLQDSTARIQGLLLDAEDISDIIVLENELDSRQSELESLEARQRGLSDQVSMSTIDLSLTTEPAVDVDDSPRSFLDGLESGWNGLVSFVSAALVVAGVLLPWAAVAAVIVVAVIAMVRARGSRNARRRSAAEQASAPGAPAASAASTPTHASTPAQAAAPDDPKI